MIQLNRPKTSGIQVTESAARMVQRIMEKEGKAGAALRVGVKGGGCSGFSYHMALEEASPKQYDSILDTDGVKILVDAKSLLYLDGTTIDFKSGLMGGGFEFQNPMAKKSCGCGHSFSA